MRGTGDSGDIESDLPDLFQAIGEAAKARETAIAIVIDEVQYIKEAEFNALIMALHRVSQKQLPLVLIGAGLPQLVRPVDPNPTPNGSSTILSWGRYRRPTARRRSPNPPGEKAWSSRRTR